MFGSLAVLSSKIHQNSNYEEEQRYSSFTALIGAVSEFIEFSKFY